MRRFAAPLFVAAVVLPVVLGALLKPSRAHRPLVVDRRRPTPDEELPVGYWVWRRIEGAGGTIEIPPGDLTPRGGPGGWPGCPEHYLCTRRGIRTLAIGRTGQLHYVANVFTSSDFQYHGSMAGSDVRLTARYSCAHPGWTDTPHRSARLLWERDGQELRVAVDPRVTDGGWPFVSEATGTWWVLRRVSAPAYYARALLRLCQPTAEHACHPGCFSDRLVGD